MSKSSQVVELLTARDPAFGLDRAFYLDDAVFDLELGHIFYREWLFAGHDCEIAAPGDYFTVQIGDYALIVLRDDQGDVRAFHNTCRHRGSIVCQKERGHVRKLVCPYHQWTYDLTGRLVYARDQPEADFDRLGLKPAHCETLAGYIFVCPADQAPDFARFADELAPYLGPYDLENAKVAFESRIVEQGNWKLVLENNRECYHCAAGHPELTRTFPKTPFSAVSIDLAEHQAFRDLWDRCETLGLPHANKLGPNAQFRAFRMPLVGEAASMTLSGEPAVKLRLGGLAEDRLGSLMMLHLPNSWNHLMADHAVSFRVLPLGPKQTELTTKWLVHKDAQEGKDYDLERLTEVWRATNDQDRGFVELAQRGLRSPSYVPGPLSEIQETGVRQFLGWYCGTMLERLSESNRLAQAV